MGRDKIEKYNYLTLMDIIQRLPTVKAKYTGNPKNPILISSTRGASTLKGNVGVVLLLDGSRVEDEQLGNVMEMSADEIEDVEVLAPWKALAYTWGALDGAIKVTTRGADRFSDVRSKGIFYTPVGLSEAKENYKSTVTSGNYRLLLDVVSPMGITSFEREVVVTE